MKAYEVKEKFGREEYSHIFKTYQEALEYRINARKQQLREWKRRWEDNRKYNTRMISKFWKPKEIEVDDDFFEPIVIKLNLTF